MDDDELKRLLDASVAETRRYFDIVSERNEKRLDLLNETVSSLGEQVEAGFAHLEEEMIRESAETRAMIRLSYQELDRRVRSLEDVVSRLQERVERLEETIH
jgi:chromosome segregation ATPase